MKRMSEKVEAFIDVSPEYKKKLLDRMRTYTVEGTQGSIKVIPVSKGKKPEYGSNVTWESRVYKKGVMGPLKVTSETVEAIGLTRAEVKQVERETGILQTLYPPQMKSEIAEIQKEREKAKMAPLVVEE